MALTKTNIGTHEDGRPKYHFDHDGVGHVVYTGPLAKGVVTLPDGNTYDVSDDYINVESLEHAAQVSDEIAKQVF